MTGLGVAAGGPVIPNFGRGSDCLRNNHWFCPSWVREHWGDILQPALIQHIELTLVVVGIGLAIAFLLALVGFRWRFLDPPLGAAPTSSTRCRASRSSRCSCRSPGSR